jgi:type VI secretion system protein ImpC
MDLEFQLGRPAGGARTSTKPFDILILGDFSGKAGPAGAGGAEAPAPGRIIPVDIDSLEGLWQKLATTIAFDLAGNTIEFAPRDLDDFHPDSLYERLPVFEELRSLRKRLADPATAQEALADVLSGAEPAPLAQEDSPVASSEAESSESGDDLFQRLLGRPQQDPQAVPATAATGESSPQTSAALDSLIRKLVAPHIVHETDPRTATAIESVDLAISQVMRDVLHHPAFQALESAWRALHELVQNVETDEILGISVCDMSREELLNALPEAGMSLQDSALFQLLVAPRRQAADDSPWSVIVGNYHFGRSPEDIALLTALGAAAAVNGGVFLGGARPDILGCRTTADLADARYWATADEDARLWQSLRSSPVSAHIGLLLPRLLSRLPYGEASEEIDRFEFEEMPQRNHEDYLWSNAAFACARLLAEEFTRAGWDMEPGGHQDLGSLPAHHYKEDGESRLQPCAELLLSESTMMAMLEQGLMPLISYRNQNTAVLSRFQSIADPAAALAGPWTR